MSAKARTVLISGAGVAGQVLAYWLSRRGFTPTVIERAPEIRRAGGHAVDLWGSGVEVVERMGILPEVEAARTANDASSMIRPGKPAIDLDVGELVSTVSDRGVEIPRDDLTWLLYEASRETCEYIFGDSIQELQQDEGGVQVAFRHAAPRRFSLVIGADGLHSAVRRLAFGEESRFRRYLGGYIAVVSTPNFLELEGRIMNFPSVCGSVYFYPVRETGAARAVFLFRRKEELDYDHRDIEQQKRLLRRQYASAGWEVPRILEHMADTEAFYFDSVSQIRMKSLSHGRVCLVGDAGYAPGAGVGGGTSLAVAAAYVLADELAAADGDHATAFPNYEQAIRDTVVRSRAIGPALIARLVPATRTEVWLALQGARLLPTLPGRIRRSIPLLPRAAAEGLRAIASISLPGDHQL